MYSTDLKRKNRKNPDRPAVSLKLSKSKSSKEKRLERYTKQCDICRKSIPKSVMNKHMLKHKGMTSYFIIY